MNQQLKPNPPTDQTLVKETFVTLWDNGPLLAILSLLLGIVSLPTLTLVIAEAFLWALLPLWLLVLPCWAALQAAQAAMFEGRVGGFGVFLRSVPRFWVRAMLFGLILSIPIVLTLFTIPLLSLDQVPNFVWAALFADGLATLGLVGLSLYFFPLLAFHDLSFGRTLINAAILAARLPFHTMGMIGMAVLFGYAIRWQPALAFFLPTIWAMFAVNNCRYVLSREALDKDVPAA